MDFYQLLKPLFFALDEETAHHVALKGLQFLPSLLLPKPIYAPVSCMGIEFPNRVGLAAGFDTNAAYRPGLMKLGFGFIEFGTVTPKPQQGNPKPRLFRQTTQRSIVNRMGFPNKGVDHLVQALQNRTDSEVIGISIGKNKDTPLENAAADYLQCLEKVYPLANYIAINLSSPNTPGLRQLQQQSELTNLLRQLKDKQLQLAARAGKKVPLVVKVSPDETPETRAQMAEAIIACEIEGVIATNTSVDHSQVQWSASGPQMGGLSGALITTRATQVLTDFAKLLDGKVALIGLGGVMDPKSAIAKLAAGATLLQVYSGLIYGGPAWLRKLIAEVSEFNG